MSLDTLAHGSAAAQAGLPEELEKSLKQLESELTIGTQKLKEIVARFEEELQDGEHFEYAPVKFAPADNK